MSRDENLPFARGDTLFGINGSETISADQNAMVQKLLGKRYVVEDPDYDGMPVTLMIAQYDGTGSLTADARGVDFTNANNTVFSDQAPGANTVSFPLDHKYEALTIRDLDACYVVVGGPCECEYIAGLTAGDSFLFDTAGKVAAVADASNHIVGYVIDAGSTNTNATIFVQPHVGIE